MSINKIKSFLDDIDLTSNKIWLYGTLICSLILYCAVIYKLGFIGAIAYALLPLTILLVILLIRYTEKSFYAIYITNFAVFIVSLFTDIKIGLTILLMGVFVSSLYLLRSIYHPINFNRSKNNMTYACLVWFAFCFLQLANPNMVFYAWAIAMPNFAFFPLICAALVPLAITRTKDIKWLLIIWSIFIIVATVKGYIQHHYGFNERELYFLFKKGGAATHIISYGVRYFSCFTDAANYGVNMGMATLCFAISALYVKNKFFKLYCIFIVAAAAYSMLISGTRSGIPVPLAGMLFYVTVIKQKFPKIVALLGVVVLIGFFRLTYIGQSNQYIRRMRTAFHPTKDASYIVRIENKEKIKELMLTRPIGYGLGLSKGAKFHPNDVMPYPPDSWLVSVWVATGYIGISLYLIIHALLFWWALKTLLYKVKNRKIQGLGLAWLSMNAGFFVVTYVNDVMQFPNSIIVYTGFALCIAAPNIEKQEILAVKKEQL